MQIFRTQRLGMLLAAFFLVGTLAACQTEEAEVDTAVDTELDANTMPADNTALVSLDMIDENPDQYLNQTVTVAGEFDGMHGASAFKLAGEGPTDGILVIMPASAKVMDASGAMMTLNADAMNDEAMFQVEGTLQRYMREDLETAHGITLEDVVMTDEDDLVLVATSITLMGTEDTEVGGEELEDAIEETNDRG